MAERNHGVVLVLTIVIFIGIIFGVGYQLYQEGASSQRRAEQLAVTQSLTVETVKASRRDIAPVYRFSSKLEPSWSMDIIVQIEGYMKKLYTSEGNRLAEGDLVAIVDTQDLIWQVNQLEANLLAAQSSLAQAQADLKRGEILSRSDAISAQMLDAYTAKRDIARAQLLAAESQLASLKARLGHGKIMAPRSGVIMKQYIQEGTPVKYGTPIVNLVDDRILEVKGVVPEESLKDISLQMPVRIRPDSLGGKEFAGTITKLLSSSNSAERTSEILVSINNEDHNLRLGMNVTGEFTAPVISQVITVPLGAVVMKESLAYIFVVDHSQVVVRRPISPGKNDNQWIEVRSGLQEGEEVIVSNLDKVQVGKKVNIEPK